MGEPKKAEPFAARSAPAPDPFELNVRTDEDYSEGEWRTLPCGLECRFAPASTTAADRVRAKLIKKHAKAPKRGFDDIPPEKQAAFTFDFIAEAQFLEFRDPKSKGPEVFINGETWNGKKRPDRVRVLSELPTVRREINDELEAVAADFGEEVEEAEKN